MGYYDDDYESGPKRQKGNRGGFLLAALVGAILGGLLILFSIPALGGMGLLPENYSSSNNNNGGVQDSGITKNVKVNVTNNVTDAVSKTRDAVVEVLNIQQGQFWNQGGQQQAAGSGSGVIYKKAGGKAYIVTNNHVVKDASRLEVTLSNGTKLKGTLRGTDPLMDLAVVEVDGSKVKDVAQFGSSSSLKPGEPAIAIGNPLGTFPGSVTQGVVSSADRTMPVDIDEDGNPDWQAEVIQTDAAINPGNSGGALINVAGQVIGINSSKIAQEEVEGIGFAIPADTAKPIINDLEKFGEVKRPFLGVGPIPLSQVSSYHRQTTLKLPSSVNSGVVVMDVSPLSPADRAGIKEMDVITEFDGKKIGSPLELRKVLYKKKVGDKLDITYYSKGKKKNVTVKLAQQKSS
ncbi:S1C family serine protease [Fictibacillus fluitans]|uniref:S1C family serine protease n=1 Tax=Fictibacillus fluitans TaxID=3058422 RepID=A0ABT8I274_9BACL|nr:S1C family serine protease [Fictibacillus sp. NE201]MDN4527131.1 S1C family serine protease [Fictibacillus sp. NE201]